ncbi:MAG: isoprenylcysteine carboxylmethyltransferase family protein [Tenuifilaceae bacterium]
MDKLLVFIALSILIIVLSWRSIFSIKNHGFYRFFSWECILWLAVSNFKYWFDNPFSFNQILSWIFLLISGYLVIAGVILLHKLGKPIKTREEEALYHFEKTSELVDTGIFKYIRHPLYASLIFLTWGIFLKNITAILLIISLLSTIFLYLTSIFDEKECINYFGEKYEEYMKRSKMFIPFIF